MVAAMPDSTQQPHASSAASAPPPSAEEEALKRNTDCVYFLASPLTCKKGSECEYRHSDYARVNPRDCYYWLNGNCLNPKCAFRHPPLDALLGTQTATAPAPLPPQAAVSMPPAVPVPASYGSAKQAVPCVFFQQGYCMKGDRCSFSHGTNPIGNKLQQPSVPMPSTELSSYNKPSGILNRCSQQQKATPGLPKPQSAPKPLPDSRKHAPVARSMKEETPRYETSLVNGRSSRLNHPHVQDDRSIQHDRETEEYMRESSPGFDVLVDDEGGDADYFHGEDQYGTHEQQYNIDHPADYAALPDMDPRMVGWEHRRNPPDQMVAYAQSETPDVDLRHRLKQRRVNGGLRSVVSSDFVPGRGSVDERRERVPSKERSVGGRLKGRLKFPERSGANGNGLLHRDREMDRERNWDINRLRGRIQEHYNSEDRGILGHSPRMRREFLDGNRGPSIIKRQQDALSFPDQQGDGNVSFEGPKPLSVLLKRKRAVDDNGLNGENRASKTEETEHDSSPQSKEGEEEKAEIADAQVNPVEKEDDRLVEGEAEHEEGDEYEYEQVDGEGEYNYDGDNAEEEEYLDDEDDDFAKKVGVMFS